MLRNKNMPGDTEYESQHVESIFYFHYYLRIKNDDATGLTAKVFDVKDDECSNEGSIR